MKLKTHNKIIKSSSFFHKLNNRDFLNKKQFFRGAKPFLRRKIELDSFHKILHYKTKPKSDCCVRIQQNKNFFFFLLLKRLLLLLLLPLLLQPINRYRKILLLQSNKRKSHHLLLKFMKLNHILILMILTLSRASSVIRLKLLQV